jgi:hypothetical protein
MLKKKKSNQEEITMENILKTMEEIKSYVSFPTYIVGDTLDFSNISSTGNLSSTIAEGISLSITPDTNTIWVDADTHYQTNKGSTAIDTTIDNKTYIYDDANWKLLEEKTKLIEEIENLKKYINELESVLTAREKFFDL